MSAEEEIVEAAAEAGVIGFGPHRDAIRYTTSEGIRIYYLRDDEIRWVERVERPRRRWLAPASTDGDRLKAVLDAVDEFEVIDKTLHNALVSGPFRDKAVHEGIAWAVAIRYRRQLRRGDFPWSKTYESIPGVGPSTAREISAGLAAYEEAPAFGGEWPEEATEGGAP